MGLHLDLDADIGGEGLVQAERLADEVAPAFSGGVESVVEEIAAGPQDDEALRRLAGAEDARALARGAGPAGLAGRREVHLDEADGAFPAAVFTLFSKVQAALTSPPREAGRSGRTRRILPLTSSPA